MGLKPNGQKPRGQMGSSLKEKRREKVILSPEEKIHSWIRSSRTPPGVREKIFKFAASSLPVFIQGEEGTGRTEVAKAIHFLSPFKEVPFLHLSCRQLSPAKFTERLSSQLKERGLKNRVSLTLYLEELDSLDWDLQGILFDLLEDQQIHWPGLEGRSFDIQAISSSSSSLSEAVGAKRFRGDLFQTLEMLPIVLLPLRERKEDIPQLVGEILQERGPARMFQKKFSPEALKVLQEYDWPGNLPELESAVLRSVALKEGEFLLPSDLIFGFARARSDLSPTQTVGRESWFDLTLPTLAHEIKNPMVAISTFAHLLPEKYDDPEFRQEFSRLVTQDVRRINELLENLLEFAQFSPPHFTPNDLNFILVEILKTQEKMLKERGGQITTELEEGLPLVLFDEAHLNFVLRNLLENALSKMNQEGPLHFSTSFSRGEEVRGQREFVELNVWYNGQEGITGDIQRTAGGRTEPDFQNLSLALLLIRKVMNQNRAKMQVDQGGEGGMAVRLCFPIVK